MNENLISDSVELQVIAFLADEIGCEPDSVLLSADLAADLGVTGDDTMEILEHFAQKFTVDWEYFDPERYVDGEGVPILETIRCWMKGKFRQKKILTVSMLVNAAVAQKWPSED
jgi:Protein of unknown function (DUF1493)